MPAQTKSLVRRISLDQARKQIRQLVFVDARSATALTRNPQQVPGAIHVSMKNLEVGAKELPRGRTLVTYCT
ncbi:MAG: hypothetical protein EPN47_19765 [Acidobacteria bacterium]|nr:MAG: hypothetical protein EPN47_19765 [Acidobacteriota bacterium]